MAPGGRWTQSEEWRRPRRRRSESRVDLEDVPILVLHYFTWLFLRLSIHITVQAMWDPL